MTTKQLLDQLRPVLKLAGARRFDDLSHDAQVRLAGMFGYDVTEMHKAVGTTGPPARRAGVNLNGHSAEIRRPKSRRANVAAGRSRRPRSSRASSTGAVLMDSVTAMMREPQLRAAVEHVEGHLGIAADGSSWQKRYERIDREVRDGLALSLKSPERVSSWRYSVLRYSERYLRAVVREHNDRCERLARSRAELARQADSMAAASRATGARW